MEITVEAPLTTCARCGETAKLVPKNVRQNTDGSWAIIDADRPEGWVASVDAPKNLRRGICQKCVAEWHATTRPVLPDPEAPAPAPPTESPRTGTTPVAGIPITATRDLVNPNVIGIAQRTVAAPNLTAATAKPVAVAAPPVSAPGPSMIGQPLILAERPSSSPLVRAALSALSRVEALPVIVLAETARPTALPIPSIALPLPQIAVQRDAKPNGPAPRVASTRMQPAPSSVPARTTAAQTQLSAARPMVQTSPIRAERAAVAETPIAAHTKPAVVMATPQVARRATVAAPVLAAPAPPTVSSRLVTPSQVASVQRSADKAAPPAATSPIMPPLERSRVSAYLTPTGAFTESGPRPLLTQPAESVKPIARAAGPIAASERTAAAQAPAIEAKPVTSAGRTRRS